MKLLNFLFSFAAIGVFAGVPGCRQESPDSATVPIVLDHNRMIVEGEIHKENGQVRRVRLWVDSGNPTFTLSAGLARDLGINQPPEGAPGIEVSPPSDVRIGGMKLNFEGVTTKVVAQPFWLFSAMQVDANLPSTVLRKYRVVLDYPSRNLTLAKPGSLRPSGTPSAAKVQPHTGIIQIDAVIDSQSYSFALDMGASYSYVSAEKLAELVESHPGWPTMTGTAGCANMWGYWPPNEETFQLARLPEITWGKEQLKHVGMVGVPALSAGGPTWGEWYSRKTHHPVDGLLGANALGAYRVEIDYDAELVYFEKTAEFDTTDLEIVGLSLRQLVDGAYQVVGVAHTKGRPALAGVESGDLLLRIGELTTKGRTMGEVVDALRGRPGETRVLTIERAGKQTKVEAKVEHFL